jgi:dUTPase
MDDKLLQMYEQQKSFMRLLQEKRGFPAFPVDLTSKAGQKFVKTISYECADELHEARQHLKNKDHRATTINEIDRAEYVEELTDALHYFFEIIIASGISMDEMFEAYMKKGEINTTRINEGY